LAAAGVPPLFLAILVAFDANARAGKAGIVSDAVKRLTGQAPAPARAFLAAHRAVLAPAR
jgi:hypothetical protein